MTDEIHELFGLVDYPMYIVTATDGRERAGCLVGFATQSSIDPPRFLVCLSDKNRTFRVALEAEVLVVHLVPSDASQLAELFGSETGDDIDKFSRCSWSEGPGGTPVLDDCGNWFAGRVLERVDCGDHHAFLLDPFEASSSLDEQPFTFHRAKRMEPGHEA
jgi:flavin reductase (DIM6/NTAB) family NADH-FMN oxidoreductase RutF